MTDSAPPPEGVTTPPTDAPLPEKAHGVAVLNEAARPMIEAGDLFDRFWSARVNEDDWQAAFPDEENGGCPCGNCRTCGIRSALTWTAALFSNPSLADKAEELKAKRLNRAQPDGEASA